MSEKRILIFRSKLKFRSIDYVVYFLLFIALPSFASKMSICNEPTTSKLIFSNISTVDFIDRKKLISVCRKQFQGKWLISISSDKKAGRIAIGSHGRKLIFYRGNHAYLTDEHDQADIYTAQDLVKIDGKTHKIYFLSALLVKHDKSPHFQGTFISSNGCRGNYVMWYLTINGKPYIFKPSALSKKTK